MAVVVSLVTSHMVQRERCHPVSPFACSGTAGEEQKAHSHFLSMMSLVWSDRRRCVPGSETAVDSNDHGSTISSILGYLGIQ